MPYPDPSGGQAPALHFLILPSAIGLQFGTFRQWRAGIEVDWRAHFLTNDEVDGGGRRGMAGWPRAFSWLGTSSSATCFSLDCRKSTLGGRSLASRVRAGIHLPSYQWLARLVPLSPNGFR